MSRPEGLNTRIFVDSADIEKIREVKDTLGFLDGVTTNPTLLAKVTAAGQTEDDLFNHYRALVLKIDPLLPEDGSISIEVPASPEMSADEMLEYANEMVFWTPKAHIKFPTTTAGLEAAHQLSESGGRVNMTLVFSQEQAAAVYAATLGANKGDVLISPFVGRLDDDGDDGMSLVDSIIEMYSIGDGHVEVLTASVRNVDHILKAIALGSDILTAPTDVLVEWANQGTPMPDRNLSLATPGLHPIPFWEDLSLSRPWREYNIQHWKTAKGLKDFDTAWKSRLLVATPSL